MRSSKGLYFLCPPPSDPVGPHSQAPLSVMAADIQADLARFTLCTFSPHAQQPSNAKNSAFPRHTDSSGNKLPNAPAGNLSLWFLPCCLLVPHGGKI